MSAFFTSLLMPQARMAEGQMESGMGEEETEVERVSSRQAGRQEELLVEFWNSLATFCMEVMLHSGWPGTWGNFLQEKTLKTIKG